MIYLYFSHLFIDSMSTVPFFMCLLIMPHITDQEICMETNLVLLVIIR
jgi:hypothetical protein